MHVSEISISPSGTHAAAATSEGQVEIWDLARGIAVNSFPTWWDFGGRRLAIDFDRQVLVAGNYYRGVRCYDINDGRLKWGRPKTASCQRIAFSKWDSRVAISREKKRGLILDVGDGSLIEEIRSAESIEFFEQDVLLLETNKHVTLRIQGSNARTPKESFGLLDPRFVDGDAVLAYSTAPLSRLDVPSMAKVWSIYESDRHFHKVAGNLVNGYLYGLDRNYKNGGIRTLNRIEWATGNPETVARIHGYRADFALNSTVVVSTSREVYSAIDGSFLTRIEPPSPA